jgi:hypothetical protein
MRITLMKEHPHEKELLIEAHKASRMDLLVFMRITHRKEHLGIILLLNKGHKAGLPSFFWRMCIFVNILMKKSF